MASLEDSTSLDVFLGGAEPRLVDGELGFVEVFEVDGYGGAEDGGVEDGGAEDGGVGDAGVDLCVGCDGSGEHEAGEDGFDLHFEGWSRRRFF